MVFWHSKWLIGYPCSINSIMPCSPQIGLCTWPLVRIEVNFSQGRVGPCGGCGKLTSESNAAAKKKVHKHNIHQSNNSLFSILSRWLWVNTVSNQGSKSRTRNIHLFDRGTGGFVESPHIKRRTGATSFPGASQVFPFSPNDSTGSFVPTFW